MSARSAPHAPFPCRPAREAQLRVFPGEALVTRPPGTPRSSIPSRAAVRRRADAADSRLRAMEQLVAPAYRRARGGSAMQPSRARAPPRRTPPVALRTRLHVVALMRPPPRALGIVYVLVPMPYLFFGGGAAGSDYYASAGGGDSECAAPAAAPCNPSRSPSRQRRAPRCRSLPPSAAPRPPPPPPPQLGGRGEVSDGHDRCRRHRHPGAQRSAPSRPPEPYPAAAAAALCAAHPHRRCRCLFFAPQVVLAHAALIQPVQLALAIPSAILLGITLARRRASRTDCAVQRCWWMVR